jgi:hypothetical protein
MTENNKSAEQEQVTEDVEVEELLDNVAGGTYGGSSDSWATIGHAEI